MEIRKICVVTGTRAEYGLLYWLMKEIQEDKELELQIVVTGMHLSPEFGLTYQQIELDGFNIAEKVEMLLSADTSSGIAKSIGLGTIGFADAFQRLRPNLIILLGDRFETLAAAQTALISRIPIAHLHGGEVTLGAYDDAIRHAITKMSTLHFVSTEGHKRRVIQLGEQPSNVYNVGACGIENIYRLPLFSKKELEKELNIHLKEKVFLITYHPETLYGNTTSDFDEVLQALREFSEATLIFTKANADNNGREINKKIEDFVLMHPENSKVFSSLGQKRYLSILKYTDVVIGNSSSGLIEAPYLKTATVNVGNRQKGRERPISVIDSIPKRENIIESINMAMNFDFSSENINIFGEGQVSKEIVKIIKKYPIISVVKEFYDWKE